jgi:NodT family efflux transporter outer membrane factor (OMF) lipoprotein
MTRHPFPILLVLLAGCSLGPDYVRPEPEIPVAYRATAQTAARAWPDNGWWRGFGSLELNGLIDAARAQNFDLAAAMARVREADAALRASGAALLPTADLLGQQSWSRSASQSRSLSGLTGVSRGVRYSETRISQLSLGISWELDFWGRLRATRDNALATALANRFDQQTVALTVVTSVASTWFQACALRDRLDVSARNLADAEFILRAITARQAAGTASLLDVSQQEALVASIRTTVPGLRSQMEQQINALGLLTGRPPSAITVRPGTLLALLLPEVAPGLPSELLARRPDVATAEAQLQAANANIRVARANFYPSITLSGTAGWSSLALGTLFGPGSLFANAAGNAAQTVFENGLRTAQFDQSRGRYDELLANYRTAVLQAFTDVENGIQAYNYATEQEALSQAAVAVAQRSADIARAQLVAGTVDIVNALQAQTTLYNNLDALAQIRLSRFQALLSLYKALGGGWTDRDVTAPETRLLQGVL